MIQSVVCPSCRKPNSPRARYCQYCGHDVILNNAGPSYVLTRVIKEGGQGAVYEAADGAGATYAVKEMLDRFSDPKERAEAVARFGAEAETLRRLAHPRIPRVYASFHDEGRHYLVMDFIRGEDLDEIVARDGPQPEARALEWAAELCDVLTYLHGEGVIYRDLKPSNIMVERQSGTLKLIDFGIAKLFQPQARGTQIGTPGYAPPEQYQGLATRLSDVYAFGATLHHLLTGRDPQQHPPFNYPPVRDLAPTVSERTERALQRALQMRQEDRFQSVAELCAALLPAQSGQVLAPAASATTPSRPAPYPAGAAPATAPPASAPAQPPPTSGKPAPTRPGQPAVPAGAPQSAPPASAPAAGGPKPAPAASGPKAVPGQPAPAAAAGASPPPGRPAPAAAAGASPPPPAAPTTPVRTPPAPAAPPARPRRGGGALFAIGALLLLLIGGAAAFLLFGQGLLQSPAAGPTATAQVLVARTFVARDLELLVPTGAGSEAVNQAFAAAFLQLARLDCACEPQIEPGTLVYLFDAAPRQLSIGADGTRYSASLQATILVPQP